MVKPFKKLLLLLTILTFLQILQPISASIKIWSPSWLKSRYQNQNIESTIATFGKVPYGHSLMGKLGIGYPLDACKPLKLAISKQSSKSFFLIAKRGGCKFAIKARNAQQIGAEALLVVDNDEDEEVN